MEFDGMYSDDEILNKERTVDLKIMLSDAEKEPLKNAGFIRKLKNELAFRDKTDKERLYNYSNFDQSDLRINFDERDKRNTETGFVLARCHKDHIEIMAKSWIPPLRYFENFIGTINHESIHPVVDRILLEDGFSHGDWDTEWMFYAGGMDVLEDINYTGGGQHYYLSNDAILNTIKAIPDYKRMMKREYLNGDYDL